MSQRGRHVSAKQRSSKAAEAAAAEEAAPTLAEVQAELEAIIEQLEDEDTGLEKSIELYERGSRLVTVAGKVLTDAEQRVRILTEGDGEDDDLPTDPE
jgi:exodeoxyribonuclease VII small subunit